MFETRACALYVCAVPSAMCEFFFTIIDRHVKKRIYLREGLLGCIKARNERGVSVQRGDRRQNEHGITDV